MAITSKQDRQGVRTATDLERKYQFGKSFAEVMGLATDAQQAADKAASGIDGLDKKLDQDEIFKRLTNNGEAQGVYKGEDGQIYINAAYIVALSSLFAKDIMMTGTFTNTAEVFLEPEQEELDTVINHLKGTALIPADKIHLYDFNNNGIIDDGDSALISNVLYFGQTLSGWIGAKTSTVIMTINMSNPQKAVRIVGENMWGRVIDHYIGVNGASMRVPKLEENIEALSVDYIVERGKTNGWEWRVWNSGTAEMWYIGTVQFDNANLISTGIEGLKMSSVDISLPITFAEPPVCVASCAWAYTDWVQCHPISVNALRLRKFGNPGSFTLENHSVDIYVSGKVEIV